MHFYLVCKSIWFSRYELLVSSELHSLFYRYVCSYKESVGMMKYTCFVMIVMEVVHGQR